MIRASLMDLWDTTKCSYWWNTE